MRRALAILVAVVVSALSCGKPEWAIPRTGGSACMCSMMCACGMSQNEDSQKERDRCRDACDCDPCAGEHKKSE